MATPPNHRSAPGLNPHQAIYQATLREAVVGAELLMVKLVSAARSNLETRAYAQRDLRLRDELEQWNKFLRVHESTVCRNFPIVLGEVFAAKPNEGGTKPKKDVDLHFAELELMDESEVLTSVALARAQQVAMQSADAALSDLNSLMSTITGSGVVHAESNPLRPENYVKALKATLAQTGVPAQAQLEWINSMGAMLGQELKAFYQELCRRLRTQGIVPAHYAVHQAPLVHGIGRGVAQGDQVQSAQADLHPTRGGGSSQGWGQAYDPGASGLERSYTASMPPGLSRERTVAAQGGYTGEGAHQEEVLLTLDKLRRLLAGELDIQVPLSPKERFAQQFSHQFENGAPVNEAPITDFDSTVPAALVALTEMKQVDRVVRKLERAHDGASSGSSVAAPIGQLRASLRSNAHNLAQVLSLEVVSLMVDNIARDARLLPPVQKLIRDLEPSLLRLSLVDPRFFSDKEHPARQLLQELTDNSLAFESAKAKGFEGFLRDAQAAVQDLSDAPIDSDEPYRLTLEKLRSTWSRIARDGERAHAEAVQVLRHVEARNLLAQKIAQSVDAHPDVKQVPSVVVDFLCGPWAQVVAQARLVGGSGSATADKYQALISALLWSAHLEMARKNVSKLTKLVPRLLSTMREGLESIEYPNTRTSAFFEALMSIHQLAFKSPEEAAPAVAAVHQQPAGAVHRAHFVDEGDPWMAPEEAKSSNFVDLADVPEPAVADAPPQDLLDNVVPPAQTLPASLDELPLGTWIELLKDGEWVRTQLTWGSPHGTLFLFTNSFGSTQSMTRRSRDRLIAAGQLRMVSSQPMVDGALDAVAQTAMRNSVDTSF